MVAVLVHEVIGVAFVLLPHLLHDALHVLLGEVGAAQDYGLSIGVCEGGREVRRRWISLYAHIRADFMTLHHNPHLSSFFMHSITDLQPSINTTSQRGHFVRL